MESSPEARPRKASAGLVTAGWILLAFMLAGFADLRFYHPTFAHPYLSFAENVHQAFSMLLYFPVLSWVVYAIAIGVGYALTVRKAGKLGISLLVVALLGFILTVGASLAIGFLQGAFG